MIQVNQVFGALLSNIPYILMFKIHYLSRAANFDVTEPTFIDHAKSGRAAYHIRYTALLSL